MPLHSNGSESFIVKCKDFDSSSKLCFEEKSSKVIYDKIFWKITSWPFSDAVMVSMAKFLVTQSPQINAEIFISRAKMSKEKWKSGCFKVNEKGAKYNIRKLVFNKEKIKLISPQAYIYLLWPKTKPLYYCKLGRDIANVRERNLESLSEWEPVSRSAAHTPRSEAHTEGTAHT